MPMQATTTTPLFTAELTPHRALGGRELGAVVTLSALLILTPIMLYPSFGIVAVAGFALVDLLAIGGIVYLALRRGKRREQVTLWRDELELVVVDAKGARTMRRFAPKQVRLTLDRDLNEKTLAMRLRAGPEAIEIGGFLNADDKSSFAKAFGTALRKARA